MKRKKTKLERFFSYSRYKRRFGASNAMKTMFSLSTDELKEKTIQGDEIEYTHGSVVDIVSHIENLKREFVGKSALCHYHAALIVLIRREVDLKNNINAFERLWNEYNDFLLAELNTRWLVAAADTFSDHSPDATERACALAISALINTVKLCETERIIRPMEDIDLDRIRHLNLHDNRIGLWDGTSAFAVGTDDTIRNFRWRIDEFVSRYGGDLVTPKILETVFIRLQKNKTLYKRFRDLHHRNKTGWW